MPKALLIDDEEDIVDLLSYHLEKKGYKVLSIGDPIAALHLIRAEKPDLILIHHLPNYSDKNTFCKKLKELPGVQNSCIICLETNLYTTDSRCENVDACIHIPLLPEVLISQIQFHCDQKQQVKPAK